MIAAQGLPVQVACRVLSVAESGYYAQRHRAPSQRQIRHAWLTEVITEVHAASHGRYGIRRVHAELTLGKGISVDHLQVGLLMQRAGLKGLTGRRRWKRILPDQISTDLVKRNFPRQEPNRLWVTDLTEHRTREDKVFCCVVLDTFSRRVVGWSIDSSPTAALATNALGMAIDTRLGANAEPGTVIHSDQGVQFGSWAFTTRAKAAGRLPSMGSVGDCYDHSMIEAFWSRMQVELLDTLIWNTRIELANAIFEYLEIWHNRKRRHGRLGWVTPVEDERHRIITAA
ncbi:IS3 family transposase [Nesterenkonia ebinurensis]|uniref:IS3 family transposase n=1 Tax=Nesterenkonia ebinurensis TaxID=2608252 RepID=UPI00123D3FC7|nr:IS3 family transposase [Nesterenkonia ebinurensis]